MGQKFPLYILYLSIARKFAAVHEPSPLDLEEADIQISLHEQIVPCIHLFTRQTFPQCLLCARKCGWHEQDIQQLLGPQFTLLEIPCEPVDCSPPGSSVCGILQQEHWSGLPFPPPVEKAWVRLNAIKHGSTNLLDRKQFTRPRQSVLNSAKLC